MLGGLTVPEIARAFLVQATTMEQRITRAKAKIKAARIPYRVPAGEDLPARVTCVLAVLFLVFNEGYLATGPDTDPVRHDLTAEAIRLTRLIRALMPGDGEVAGLLALMLLTEARRTARVSASGELVTLDEQDRGHGTRARAWARRPAGANQNRTGHQPGPAAEHRPAAALTPAFHTRPPAAPTNSGTGRTSPPLGSTKSVCGLTCPPYWPRFHPLRNRWRVRDRGWPADLRQPPCPRRPNRGTGPLSHTR
jgi:predicted RNA polymerase sigma factor